MKTGHLRFAAILVAAGLLSVSGCREEGGGLGPGTLIEVNNVEDAFRWQFTATSAVTETLNYSWSYTGQVARVTQGGGILSGSASVVIRDSGGTEVYSRDLDEAGTFATAAGVAGQWTVVVTLTNATAVTSFRVEVP